MKYAFGVDGVIGNTGIGFPLGSGHDSLPVRPSKGCPDGATFPALAYRYPSMWSKERFSSIRTTMWATAGRPFPDGVVSASAMRPSLAVPGPQRSGLAALSPAWQALRSPSDLKATVGYFWPF